MVPLPINENAPKAPNKSDRAKVESAATISDLRTQHLEITTSGLENKEVSVSRMDDVQLKALLDETINYKIPKDDRRARSTSASDLQSVLYENYSATHRTRRRRQPNSLSENLTDGGSLNNLAKEELYTAASCLHNRPKTVSTQQGQGGSLPCNLNAEVTPLYDKQFFKEARRKMQNKKAKYTAIDVESESLLVHDSLNQDDNEQPEIEIIQIRIPQIPMMYTSRFNLEIRDTGGGGSNVDDLVTVLALDCPVDKVTNEVSYKPVKTITPATHYPAVAHSSMLLPSPISSPFNRKSIEDKKVDENGNALGQSNSEPKMNKKKKKRTHKNVVVLEAKDVAGHRGDIINDLDKLVEYIGGNKQQTGAKSQSNVHKAKFHKKHFSSSGEKKSTNYSKKQWTHAKGKLVKMQKSSSLEEISISKLDDFSFSQKCDMNKAPLRSPISNANRPRERRSWGNSESLQLHTSVENLETADFGIVTQKKKSKKRRNSLSGRRLAYSSELHDNDFNLVYLPETRGKSTCAVPHSNKSNDLSDVDSVHSLPIDNSETLNSANLNLPISYVGIAKNSNPLERPKWNRLPNERIALQSKTGMVEVLDSVEVEQVKVQTPPKAEQEPIYTLPPISNDVIDNFTARFFVPDTFQNYNHDEMVNFIGLAWEDTINELNQNDGKVKYYIDQSTDKAGPSTAN